ncbi:MAG: transglycosylase SLT domain-containing protein [Deltaproteobacteria bacterium]|nr:transglycosylase SLT domain-containing protein [Deltaproteobacteria bacterium]
MNIQLNPRLIHKLSIALTIIFCFGLFHFFIPLQINAKASVVLAPQNNNMMVANNTEETALSQSLLDYIQESRKEIEQYDPEEDAMIEAYQKFEQEYSKNAEQILSKRFKLPEMEPGATNNEFTVTKDIKEMVDFWTYMFGVYTKDQVIFYNEDNVGIVYSVLDFSELGMLANSGLDQYKTQMIAEEVQRLKKIIQKVASKINANEEQVFAGLNPQEVRIASLLINAKDHLDLSEQALSDSLKFRYGFAHRFKEAIVQSGMYMDNMRGIFDERGLPVELTMIPFIESSFHLTAYSSAGAAGIWQFIEATGKRYLRIDEYVDERYDPILAAYAAATHLYNEYKMLNSWPLTINAYNTGPGRMLQAIKALETTDIATIIKKFKGSGYGTDSRNYYPEFLAALNVYNNRAEYFGDIEPLPPEQYEYVLMPDDVDVKELARLAGVQKDVILEMNLSLRPDVAAGNKKLPKGYFLKIPPDTRENILLALQDIHHETEAATHHFVQKGDTLQKISARYDISIQELSTLNRIIPNQKLTEGDIIRLPNQNDSEYSSYSEEDTENDNNNEFKQQTTPDRVNPPVL